MRWFATAAFAALLASAVYVVPGGWKENHDAVWTVSVFAVYFLFGALVGRWWALILAFLPVLLAVPLGVQGDADGTPTWWWILVDTAVIFVWVTLAGLLARRLARAWRRRDPRTDSV